MSQQANAQACVFWARQLTDLSISGDAWSWWDNASGRYDRSGRPSVGSVLVFRRTSQLRRGHVSTVSRVIDARTITVDHSWLSDNRLYRGMRVVDVSPNNDWTQVRVWHPKIDELGTRVYPTNGFVHPQRARPELLEASLATRAPSATERRSVRAELTDEGERAGRRAVAPAGRSAPRPSARETVREAARNADAGPVRAVERRDESVAPQRASAPPRKPVQPVAADADTATAPSAGGTPATVTLPARNPLRAMEAAVRAATPAFEAAARVEATTLDLGDAVDLPVFPVPQAPSALQIAARVPYE